jgi:hypothetical protein
MVEYKDSSTDRIRSMISFQLDISWQLLEFHLTGLEDKECLWRPGGKGLHVHHHAGIWRSDWPDRETYDIGPASVSWLTWHIIFWWSMALDHSFGEGKLTREDVQWPGSTADAKEKITSLRNDWTAAVSALSDEDMLSCERTRWPFTNRPFYELAAWLNLELMKNASEIGYVRFLYASQPGLV